MACARSPFPAHARGNRARTAARWRTDCSGTPVSRPPLTVRPDRLPVNAWRAGGRGAGATPATAGRAGCHPLGDVPPRPLLARQPHLRPRRTSRAERLAAERDGHGLGVPARAQRGRARSARSSSTLMPLRERGVIDQVVVVDDSTDGTAEIARELGAEVHDQEQLLPELGPVLGKGDAMWRALHVLTGEVVCFLDADSERFGPTSRAACSGRCCAGREICVRQGLLPPPVPGRRAHAARRRRPRHRAHGPAAAEPVLSRAGGGRTSRWRARSPPAASCSSGCRSSPATASTSPCCSTPTASSGSTRSPRSTSTCARTPTSHCATSARWPSRCSAPWPRAWSARAGCSGPLPTGFLSPASAERSAAADGDQSSARRWSTAAPPRPRNRSRCDWPDHGVSGLSVAGRARGARRARRGRLRVGGNGSAAGWAGGGQLRRVGGRCPAPIPRR